MNDIDLAQRIKQAVVLKDRKQVEVLLALPAARTATYNASIQLAEAVDAARTYCYRDDVRIECERPTPPNC